MSRFSHHQPVHRQLQQQQQQQTVAGGAPFCPNYSPDKSSSGVATSPTEANQSRLLPPRITSAIKKEPRDATFDVNGNHHYSYYGMQFTGDLQDIISDDYRQKYLGGYTRRGSLQLWQFLVALLDNPVNSSFIAWTGRGLEFKLIEPEEVARRWGLQKNRTTMNYDKLSRSLRYYYEKGIMQKVAGERYVYRFVCEPEVLFAMAFPGSRRPVLKPEVEAPTTKTDHVFGSASYYNHHHHGACVEPSGAEFKQTATDPIASVNNPGCYGDDCRYGHCCQRNFYYPTERHFDCSGDCRDVVVNPTSSTSPDVSLDLSVTQSVANGNARYSPQRLSKPHHANHSQSDADKYGNGQTVLDSGFGNFYGSVGSVITELNNGTYMESGCVC